MAKFFLGLVSGIILCVLGALIIVFVFIRVAASFGERAPEVADGSTLVFTLDGDVPEKTQPDLPLPLLQDQSPITVEQVWETFHKAAISALTSALRRGTASHGADTWLLRTRAARPRSASARGLANLRPVGGR